MRPFSLAHLTVLEVGPPDLITLAALAGFRAVGVRLCSPTPGGIEYPLQPGSSAMREVKQRMAHLDVQVSDIEVVRIAPDTIVETYATAFEAGAELGARRVCVNIDDPERARVIDRFGALCDLAAPFGLALDVEFMLWRPVARLEDAVDVVSSAQRPNGFVMIDALHLIRSGGDVAAVASLDPRLIGSVQLCDAPLASPPPSGIIDEARSDRLVPGEGELPLLELLAALADDIPTAVEVPLTRLHPSLGPLERARRVHAATQALLASRQQRVY
jgi:sugar phosphate isomerase/epimerase